MDLCFYWQIYEESMAFQTAQSQKLVNLAAAGGSLRGVSIYSNASNQAMFLPSKISEPFFTFSHS